MIIPQKMKGLCLSHDHLLIGLIILLLVLSFGILSYVEEQQHAHMEGWSLSFADPTHREYGFTITNHSEEVNFHYEILRGNESVEIGDVSILSGTKQSIPLPFHNYFDEKVTIIVTTPTDEKYIYK